MATETIPYAASHFLVTGDDQRHFLTEAFEDGDHAYLAHALGVVVRSRGVENVANDAGLSEDLLEHELLDTANPRISTVLAILKAMGMKLSIA